MATLHVLSWQYAAKALGVGVGWRETRHYVVRDEAASLDFANLHLNLKGFEAM